MFYHVLVAITPDSLQCLLGAGHLRQFDFTSYLFPCDQMLGSPKYFSLMPTRFVPSFQFMLPPQALDLP